MAEYVLEVKNLVKQFGEFTAVDGVSFVVKRGEVVGFLGPNGAGKTTTIQILMGLTTPSSGSISYFGQDFAKHSQAILNRVNTTSAYSSLQGHITVWENLVVFAYLYNVPNLKKRITEIVEELAITPFKDKLYGQLSAGQKTRVNLAKSLLNSPEILLMDEPTASLDPDIADKFMSMITALQKERSISLLYTSHDMDEITRICDRVIFLDHGKIVAEDTPLGLTKRIKHSTLKITFDAEPQLVKKYLAEKNLEGEFPKKQVLVIDVEEALIPKIIFGLSRREVWITDIEIQKPSLEDVFLDIARGGLRV